MMKIPEKIQIVNKLLKHQKRTSEKNRRKRHRNQTKNKFLYQNRIIKTKMSDKLKNQIKKFQLKVLSKRNQAKRRSKLR